MFQLRGIAIDQSVEACKLTVENAHLNGVSDRLGVLTDTWSESMKSKFVWNFVVISGLLTKPISLGLKDEKFTFDVTPLLSFC